MKIFKSNYFAPISIALFISGFVTLRFGIKDSSIFSKNLWAEDGLFILCNLKVSPSNCFFDSYSGYLNLYSRFISYFISKFSIEDWAFINFLFYIVNVAVIASIVSFLLQFKLGKIQTLLLISISYLLPIFSQQVIAVNASFYLILVYYSLLITIFLDFNLTKIFNRQNILIFFIYIITIFSNPLSMVLLFIFILKNLSEFKKQLIPILVLSISYIPQFLVVFTSNGNRTYVSDKILTLQISLNYLIKTIISTFYLKPDILLLDPIFGQGQIVGLIYKYSNFLFIFSLLIFLIFLFSNSYLIVLLKPVFLLVISMLVILLVSSYTNGSPERFLVLTSSLFVSFLMYLLSFIRFRFIYIPALVLLLFTLSIPLNNNFANSEYRSTGPDWIEEVKQIRNICEVNNNSMLEFEFSPYWPTKNKHPYPFFEPTTNYITCNKLLKIS